MTTRIDPIRKLLIANRGEIACRIIKTAKRMNIKTVAIFSAADRNSMHVRLADEAHYVGEAEPQKSYLNQDKIFEVAHKHNVSAIHPGYGFLSENSEFSERCENEQLVFVGPSSSSIRSMGIKNESKRIMIEAGVSVVPGYHGLEQDNDLLLEEARKIGYPVLIKPVRGGGGKGMRVVRTEQDFLQELESSRRESLKSFNDQSILLEKYIEKPRHVEVQVFGDTHDNHVFLFERDCSIQRRHQKIIEEAPAPLLSEEKRQALGRQAVAAAKAVNYVGAGTVEFILDKLTSKFYFMEMNTRLQVEHPITEMITDTDLVEWQLRVASGEKLPKKQSEIAISGHAFEARIYAEDPSDNFLPQSGPLDYICLPNDIVPHKISGNNQECVRLDTGVTAGDLISPYYDPMIAKLIVWSKDRNMALKKLNAALQQYVVVGVPTNLKFLTSLANNKSFEAADVGTDFIDLHYDELFSSRTQEQDLLISSQGFSLVPEICASVYRLLLSLTLRPREDLNSFRILRHKKPIYKFNLKLSSCPDIPIHASYESLNYNSGNMFISYEEDCKISLKVPVFTEIEKDVVIVKLNNESDVYKFTSKSSVFTDSDANETIIILQNCAGENHLIKIEFDDVFKKDSISSDVISDPLVAKAPMPGIIEKVLVSEGDLVKKDQSLVIMSAMKMEYTIKSYIGGIVVAVNYKPGEFTKKDSVLVRLEYKN